MDKIIKSFRKLIKENAKNEENYYYKILANMDNKPDNLATLYGLISGFKDNVDFILGTFIQHAELEDSQELKNKLAFLLSLFVQFYEKEYKKK